MDTRGSGKKYYKEIDKMDCLKRTGNQLVPVSCLGFGNSGKYCFVSQHKQYSKEYLSFIYICSNLGCLFVGVHRHFVLYGLMEYLRKSLDRQFSADEVLQLLGRFFNLEMLKPEDDEKDNFSQGEEFSLPESFLNKEE